MRLAREQSESLLACRTMRRVGVMSARVGSSAVGLGERDSSCAFLQQAVEQKYKVAPHTQVPSRGDV